MKSFRSRAGDKGRALEALRDYEQMSKEEDSAKSSPENRLHVSQGQDIKSKKPMRGFDFSRALEIRASTTTTRVNSGETALEEQRDENHQNQASTRPQEEGTRIDPSESLADRERSFRTNLQQRAHELATRERSARSQKTVQSIKLIPSVRSTQSTRSVHFEEEEEAEEIEKCNDNSKSGHQQIPSHVEKQGEEKNEDAQSMVSALSKNDSSKIIDIAKSLSHMSAKERQENTINAVKSNSSYAEKETLSEFASRLERSIRMLSVADSTGKANEQESDNQLVEDKHIFSAMTSVTKPTPPRRGETVRQKREQTEPTLPSGSLRQHQRPSSSRGSKVVKTISSSTKGSNLSRTISSGLAKSIRLMTGKDRSRKSKSSHSNFPAEEHQPNPPEESKPQLSEEDRLMEECIERQELKAREAYIKAMQEHQSLVRSGKVREDSQEFIFSQKKLQAFFAKIEYWENMKNDFQANPSAFNQTARGSVIEALSMDNNENNKESDEEEMVEMNEQKAREAYVKAMQHHQTLIQSGEKPGTPKWVESEKWQQNCLATLQHWENQKTEIYDCDTEEKEREAREAYIRAMKYHQKLVNSKVEPGSKAWIESERNQRECLAKLQYWETFNMGKARSNEDDCDKDVKGFGFEAAEMKTIYFDTPKKVGPDVPTKTMLNLFSKAMPDLFGNFVYSKEDQQNGFRKERKGAKKNRRSTDGLSDIYSDGSPSDTNGEKRFWTDKIFSVLLPQCTKTCCGTNQPCTKISDSDSNEYDDRENSTEINAKNKKSQHPEVGRPGESIGSKKIVKATGGGGGHTMPGNFSEPAPVTQSLPNPAMYAIENEAREILGHLSNDYESTRIDESFTGPTGLTPKGGSLGLSPTANGGSIFWTGDAGGPMDFTQKGNKGGGMVDFTTPAAYFHDPVKDSLSLRRRSVLGDASFEEEQEEEDENSAISYALGHDEPTFFCGLERF